MGSTTQPRRDSQDIKNIVMAEHFRPPQYSGAVPGDDPPPYYDFDAANLATRPGALQSSVSVRDRIREYNRLGAQNSNGAQPMPDADWLEAYFYTGNVDDQYFCQQMDHYHLSMEPHLDVKMLSARILQARKILYKYIDETTAENEAERVKMISELSVGQFRCVGYDIAPDVYVKRSWSNDASADELSFISSSSADPKSMSDLVLKAFANGRFDLTKALYAHIEKLYPFGQRVFMDEAKPGSTLLAKIEYYAQTVTLYGLLQIAVLSGNAALVDLVFKMGKPHPSPTQYTLLVALAIARGNWDAILSILENIMENNVELLLPEEVFQDIVTSTTLQDVASAHAAQKYILSLDPTAFGLPNAFRWQVDQPPLHYLTRDPIADCQRYDCVSILETPPGDTVTYFTVATPDMLTD
ncbi:hypothetical protein H4R34_004069 [Dimargaris verticillata]|uniref:Uncharacterized protein n=1 Tax=Dimargaris verticillata TaxID=2761393 RepID=A0A9W8B5N7_9FUNG|nr:hypothetical protein H4R34_004069 [Dimargaris verticillata]